MCLIKAMALFHVYICNNDIILFSLHLFFYLYFFMRTIQTIIRYLNKKDRNLREKKKETRKGGVERFFSLQAALPRLFLGRILPKKSLLTKFFGVMRAAEDDVKFYLDYWFGRWVRFQKFSAQIENFRGHASRRR
jgi:hypothetical protein